MLTTLIVILIHGSKEAFNLLDGRDYGLLKSALGLGQTEDTSAIKGIFLLLLILYTNTGESAISQSDPNVTKTTKQLQNNFQNSI